MKHSPSVVRLSALCAAVLTLVACNASVSDSTSRTRAEAHIRANIGEISTTAPVLGGTFQVRTIEWVDEDTVRITYDDGHIELIGTADIAVNDDDAVVLSRFRIVSNDNDNDQDDDDDNDSSDSSRSGASQSSLLSGASAISVSSRSSAVSMSSMSSRLSSNTSVSSVSSASSRTGAGFGEFCGGIAGIMCESGLTCNYDGTYPDAGGTCVQG